MTGSSAGRFALCLVPAVPAQCGVLAALSKAIGRCLCVVSAPSVKGRRSCRQIPDRSAPVGVTGRVTRHTEAEHQRVTYGRRLTSAAGAVRCSLAGSRDAARNLAARSIAYAASFPMPSLKIKICDFWSSHQVKETGR